MTQVKTLHFDNTDTELDFVKVTYKNDEVVLLDTDERGDVASVLKDLEDGLFEDFVFGFTDSKEAIACWDRAHPNAVIIYGE